jgi:nickel/cobalt transporter (NicO) family protein
LRGDRRTPFLLAAVLAGLAGPTLSAHRQDEYLQASRVAVEPRRIELQIDLTPGIAIAPAIIGDLDRDGDGTLSRDEQRVYVERVFDAVELRVDGRTLHLESVAFTFPALDAFRTGNGTTRLRTAAVLPELAAGDHELVFRNRHRPDVSVYLANALIPDGDSIAITTQRRDATQRDLAIAFIVRHQKGSTPLTWAVVAGVILLGTPFAASWRRNGRSATC